MEKEEFKEKVISLYNAIKRKGYYVHVEQISDTEFHLRNLGDPISLFGGERYSVFLKDGEPTYVILAN